MRRNTEKFILVTVVSLVASIFCTLSFGLGKHSALTPLKLMCSERLVGSNPDNSLNLLYVGEIDGYATKPFKNMVETCVENESASIALYKDLLICYIITGEKRGEYHWNGKSWEKAFKETL